MRRQTKRWVMGEIPKCFNFIGAPGCGKGTVIKEVFGSECTVVSMSESLTALLHAPNIGEIVCHAMRSGLLVPTEIVMPCFKDLVGKIPYTGRPQVLDGALRTELQWNIGLPYINGHDGGRHRHHVINVVMETDLKTCASRMLLRGRPDDTEKVIAVRMAVFQAFTKPLIELVKQLYHVYPLVLINGNQSKDEVIAEAIAKFSPYMSVAAN